MSSHTGSCWRAEGVIRRTKSLYATAAWHRARKKEHPFSEEFRRTGEMADEEANRFDGDFIDIAEPRP